MAHRDYSVEGAGTEIWLFDDRMEVISPGTLPGELRLDEVLTLDRVHPSRNPHLMRSLVDLGAAHDQGEGIPRRFLEMQDAFLPQPEIHLGARHLKVTLRPALTASTLLRRLRDHRLLDLHNHGALGYSTLPAHLAQDQARGVNAADGVDNSQDRGVYSPEQRELCPEPREAVAQLGKRPRKEQVRAITLRGSTPRVPRRTAAGRWRGARR